MNKSVNGFEVVNGDECLEYIKRPIGFAGHHVVHGGVNEWTHMTNGEYDFNLSLKESTRWNKCLDYNYKDELELVRFKHDITKRKIGLVLNKFDDGGLHVKILGNEPFNMDERSTAHFDHMYISNVAFTSRMPYAHSDPLSVNYDQDGPYDFYPRIYPNSIDKEGASTTTFNYYDENYAMKYATFDELLDLVVPFSGIYTFPKTNDLGLHYQQDNKSLTNDLTTCPVFGEGVSLAFPGYCDASHVVNYLQYMSGPYYDFLYFLSNRFYASCPKHFTNALDLENYAVQYGTVPLITTNGCLVPFNLILTESETYAQAYLSNGTLPPDAFLYPLNWNELPSYTPDDDDGDDGNDDNTPDDDSRDIDPFEVTPPSFTPSQLSNYNWYWLDVSQFEGFINWFWHDVGGSNIFDDLINKIQGLYNDLGNAVLMCRFFPCDDNATRIGGLSSSGSNIKVGMIEKQGTVPTLSGSTPPVVHLGHVTVPEKYNSFVDMSPFSECSVYLPFHGFVDLDMNIYNGHDLYIDAVYDHLSGTIQYFLLCDNTFITNTIVAKMAVDIPITLQTKNDRDSMIFQNVSNAVSGLIGAGTTLATGNPIGLMVGANSIASAGQASAPLTVRGTVGESGAFYSDPYCQLIVRRPTISKPETWKKEVGQMCGKSYHLSSLSGKGLTICYNPRITFKAPRENIPAPLQTEIDEIYDYLEKGVIL